jgi:hypothetical protein
MASEQVRLASKALGPLLRRHGTSPALKVTLRQAVKTLARALVETDTLFLGLRLPKQGTRHDPPNRNLSISRRFACV